LIDGFVRRAIQVINRPRGKNKVFFTACLAYANFIFIFSIEEPAGGESGVDVSAGASDVFRVGEEHF
jgi:hypothetical protein